MTVPVTLAGPSARLNNGQIDAEERQSCTARQPLTELPTAWGVEGVPIIAAGLRGSRRKIQFFHRASFSCLIPTLASEPAVVSDVTKLPLAHRPRRLSAAASSITAQ